MPIQTISSNSVDVLIVEDDGLTQQLLRQLLKQRGYRCAETAELPQGSSP